MKKFVLIALGCTMATGVLAESQAFQLSLIPDIALHSRDTRIEGVSLGLWNENPGTQWQIGIVNGATGDSKGLQWCPFTIGSVVNYAENFTGAQIGIVNYASGEFVGLQWGAVNLAKSLTGLQLGFVNYAETADSGVQIGLVNIIEDNEWFTDFPDDLAKGFVFVNWSFGE